MQSKSKQSTAKQLPSLAIHTFVGWWLDWLRVSTHLFCHCDAEVVFVVCCETWNVIESILHDAVQINTKNHKTKCYLYLQWTCYL